MYNETYSGLTDLSSGSTESSSIGFFKKLSLGKKLGAGFGLVTLVLVAVVFITFQQIEKTSAITSRVMDLRTPTAQSSLMVLNGINHSLAALRGWMILGKDKFKVERALAWSEEIDPS